LSTHPAPVKRMETLAALVPQMMPYYQDKSPRPTYPLRSMYQLHAPALASNQH
jgi:predicted Zn-dependent protease